MLGLKGGKLIRSNPDLIRCQAVSMVGVATAVTTRQDKLGQPNAGKAHKIGIPVVPSCFSSSMESSSNGHLRLKLCLCELIRVGFHRKLYLTGK